MKIKGMTRPLFYLFFGLLFLTGTSWWAFEKWVRVQTALGEDHHPAQILLFRVHGFAAYLFLLLLGYLLHSHVRPGLLNKQKKSYKSGIGMILVIALLILTSSTDLFGPEGGVREFLVSAHRYLGLSFPLFLAMHLLAKKIGRKHERNRQAGAAALL